MVCDLRDERICGPELGGCHLREAAHRLFGDGAELAVIHVPIGGVTGGPGGGFAAFQILTRDGGAAQFRGKYFQIDALFLGQDPNRGSCDNVAHIRTLTNWPKCIGFP